MKKLFLLLVAVLTIGLCASAQTRTVSGTVLDAVNDEPLIGASVTAHGATTGVATDAGGAFTLTVPASVTKLTVSYVGYEAQHVNITSGAMVIKLHPAANTLDDVIAVAYGTAKRSEYTGSAGVVKAEAIENTLSSTVTSALSGRVAGVQTFSSNGQPGTSPTVRIRGTGSINASAAPLYVVDGVPFMGEISDIAAQDVESMVVLKDAASTALYGARGANGVILVTTRKGQEGKARISAEARWGSNSRGVSAYNMITDPREYMEQTYKAMYNGQAYLAQAAGNAVSPSAINQYINSNLWGFYGYQTWTIPAGQNIFDMNGRFNPDATPGYWNGKYYLKADDWAKEGLFNGLRQEYNVSITGGTPRLQYYLSASYLNDEGIIKNSKFNRFSTRASVDYQANDWLKIGSSMNYVYSISSSPRDNDLDNATSAGNVFYAANSMPPIYPVYVRGKDGNILINEKYGHKIYDYGQPDTDYGNGNFGIGRIPSGNAIGSLLYDMSDYIKDILDAKWYAVLTPIKGLTITENVGYYLNNDRSNRILNPVYGQMASFGGQALQGAGRDRDITLQTLVNYDFTIKDVHNIGLMAGYESEDYASDAVSGQGTNLYNPLIPYLSNVIDNFAVGGSHAELSHRGFLFRGKYNYAEKYFVVASVRRDGSSRFAPGHRWGTFWSASLGWDIAKEKFLQESTVVDLLKFRASFGQNGNDGIGNSVLYMPWIDFFSVTGANGVFSDATLAQKGNRDITWETSNAFNIGFDYSFFNGTLQGSLEYYSRQTSDMLFNLPVAPSLGYSSIPSNVGSMRNSGFEFDILYRAVNTKDFVWDINLNMTYGKNKILKLSPDILNEKGEWVAGTYRRMREGHSMWEYYYPKYAGVIPATDANGNPNKYAGYAGYWAKGHGGDQTPMGVLPGNPEDEVEYITPDYSAARTTNSQYTGDLAPKVYGGFGTSIEAYGIDFSMSFAYQLGGRLLDTGYQNLMSSGSQPGAWHKDVLNAWSPTNQNTDIPMLFTDAEYSYSSSTSDRFLISSNYLALNNITIGYTFPAKWTSKLGLSSVRIYGVAEDLALWSERKGLDPRQGFGSSSNYTYSPIRKISGGIKVNF